MSELRAFVLDQARRRQPPVFIPLRLLTAPLSWQLAKWKVSPHLATLAGVSCAVTAAAQISLGRTDISTLTLILASYLFDCMDGELARVQQRSSDLGAQLDQFANWIALIALQIGVSLGASRDTGNPNFLVWGLFSVSGWCTFYYIYLQIARWTAHAPEGFAVLRTLSLLLFWLMPLDENLVFLFVLARRTDLAAIGCAILSWALSISVAALYTTYAANQLRKKE